MELHDPTLHQKLIEMCDCYLDTDYPAKLHAMTSTPSTEVAEESVKYLALAILYAITEKARKLSIKRKKEHITVTITVDDAKISLPTPPLPLFTGMLQTMKAILHMEGDKVAMPLALGLRSGGLEVQVKLEAKEDKESLKFKFPQL